MKKLALLLLPLTTACADRGLGDPESRETHPPSLVVTAPERAQVIGGFSSVVVRGTASDAESGLASVTVNGEDVDVRDDGSFEVQIPAPPGITLIHTEAKDRDGNVKSDSRSVMTGDLEPGTQAVEDAFAARVNDETLAALGLIAADVVEATDLGAAAAPYNPIMDKGITCLNVQVSILSIDKSAVLLDLAPVPGGVSFTARLDDLDVVMDADFKAACIPGSSGLYLTASTFTLSGTMAIGVGANGLDASVLDATGAFTGFNLDVGFIPGSVVELIVSDIDQRIADQIALQLEQKVPALLEQQLAFGVQRTVVLMEKELEVFVKPASASFDSTGGTISLDARFSVKGSTGGAGWLSTPEPLPAFPAAEAPGDGFRLALADDALNQALNAFWAAGVMEKSIAVGAESDTGLAGLVDRVDVWLPLPPVASARAGSGSALVATIGDLQVDVVRLDAAGAEEIVTRLAISAEVGVTAEIDAQNRVRLRAVNPIAWVDVVEEGVTGPNPLNDSEIEALASFVVSRATTMIGSIAGEVPIPSFPSAAITNLEVEASPGYSVLGGNVEPL